MKKFLLIIFLFLSCINVFASERSFAGSEYLEGISYLKNNGDIVQYRNAQVIRDVVTGEIAYCVEPFKLMVNNSDYSESNGYDSVYGINNDVWEKIKLFAYYGYGYKNHTDKKWINITQMSIWRTIYPNYQFEWINNVSDKEIINPFNDEVNELNDLVNSHYILPSFSSNYIFSVGRETIIQDSNSVLDNYKIKSSDFDVRIQDNQLVFNKVLEEKQGKVVLERASEVFPESVKYFYSTESQNVMERGNIKPITMEIDIEFKSGKIKVNKIDSESNSTIPQGEAQLDGAVFELLNGKKEVLKELVVKNNYIEFDNLPFDLYYIREKKPGSGYYLNKKTYDIRIDKNNLEKEITIDNQIIKSKVSITKFFGTKEEYEKNEMKKEKDIVFIIYDKDGNNIFTGATNEDGIIEVMLPYGNYSLEQVNTTEGYEKVDKYNFTINEDNSVSYDIVLNDYKIEVPNASMSLIKSLSILLMEFVYV